MNMEQGVGANTSVAESSTLGEPLALGRFVGRSPRSGVPPQSVIAIGEEGEIHVEPNVAMASDEEVEEPLRQPAQEVPLQHLRTIRWVGEVHEMYNEIHPDDFGPKLDDLLGRLRAQIRVSMLAHVMVKLSLLVI